MWGNWRFATEQPGQIILHQRATLLGEAHKLPAGGKLRRSPLNEVLLHQNLLPANARSLGNGSCMTERCRPEHFASRWQTIKCQKHVPCGLTEEMIRQDAIPSSARVVDLTGELTQLPTGRLIVIILSKNFRFDARDLIELESEIDLQPNIIGVGIAVVPIDYGNDVLVLAGHGRGFSS